MRRLIPVAAIAAVALAGSSHAAEQKTALAASVGPSFTISLKKGGKKVTTLKPGHYVLNVSDRSDFHNFHITGPGVDKKTTVAFEGSRTFSVMLRRGTYRYVCDPHKGQMKGSFTVR